jgi:hypothetical protein
MLVVNQQGETLFPRRLPEIPNPFRVPVPGGGVFSIMDQKRYACTKDPVQLTVILPCPRFLIDAPAAA